MIDHTRSIQNQHICLGLSDHSVRYMYCTHPHLHSLMPIASMQGFRLIHTLLLYHILL